jgi:3-oxoacyl-[acyl-carrier-protein] synthase III
METINVGITETACYLPAQVLSNQDIIRQFNLSIDEAWIESRTGIKQRHWMVDGQTTSDMVVEVANRILAKRNIKANQLDRIVLATISGDYPSPATAAIVAQRLRVRCPAFDISAACAGFLYGLDIGAGSIRNGERYVLVLAADARSRFINKFDRRGVVLFADGAAGALLEPVNEPGLLGISLATDGTRDDLGTWIPAGGAKKPATAETIANGEHFLHVDSLKDIFPRFIGYVRESVDKALHKAGLTLRDIDLFIPHQGNAHLIDLIIDDLNFPAARTINNVAVHGNTAGASIPIALAEAFNAGRIKRGDVVLMSTAGAGNVFGAVVCKV